MKRIIKHLLLSLFFLSTISFASTGDIPSTKAIQFITPVFCNNRPATTTKLVLSDIKPNKDLEICLAALNNGTGDLLIKMYFVDGFPDKEGKIGCGMQYDLKIDFAKFVYFPVNEYNKNDKIENEMIFNIKPGEIVEKRAIVNFPSNYEGQSVGCMMTETALKPEIKRGTMGVNVRRANAIRIDVNGKINIGLDIAESKRRFFAETPFLSNDYISLYELNNTGNIAISVNLTSKIRNVLGFEHVFNIDEVVLPGENKVIKQDVRGLPIYKGAYLIQNTLKYSPKFDFKSSLTDSLNKEQVITNKSFFYIFPTTLTLIIILSIVIVGGLVYVLFIKKVRRHKNLKPFIEEYKVKKGDDIAKVSEKFNCNWHDIARLNKLTKPYDLKHKEGDVILVYNLTSKVEIKKVVKTKSVKK